jgi:hypothetical protein
MRLERGIVFLVEKARKELVLLILFVTVTNILRETV